MCKRACLWSVWRGADGNIAEALTVLRCGAIQTLIINLFNPISLILVASDIEIPQVGPFTLLPYRQNA